MCSKSRIDVIYIIPKVYLNLLTPYINSIETLKNDKFNVTVFSKYNPDGESKISESFFYNIKYFKLPNISPKKIVKGNLGRIYKIIICHLEPWYFLWFVNSKIYGQKKIIIATDPLSLFIAAKLRKKIPFVYFPQELLHSGDTSGYKEKFWKKIEKKYNKYARFSVSFDPQRALLLENDNCIKNGKSVIIPNSIPGAAVKRRSAYLRDRLNIPSTKKIVLYTGGLANYNLTLEIIESTRNWPEYAVLVMHFWGSNDDMLIVKDAIKKTGRKIYLSTDLLPFDEIDQIYQSADIGLALYGKMTINHKYAGFSSGKMFNFLHHAVPVLTNSTSFLLKNIKENNCGECIKNVTEIGSAIEKIITKEDKYISGCIDAYQNFEFVKHHENFEKAIVECFNS